MKYTLLALIALLLLLSLHRPEQPISRSEKSIRWFEGMCAEYGQGVKCINISDNDKHKLSCTCSNEKMKYSPVSSAARAIVSKTYGPGFESLRGSQRLI
jgi:hypothetical protein